MHEFVTVQFSGSSTLECASVCVAERDCDFCVCVGEFECRRKLVAKILVMECCNFFFPSLMLGASLHC